MLSITLTLLLGLMAVNANAAQAAARRTHRASAAVSSRPAAARPVRARRVARPAAPPAAQRPAKARQARLQREPLVCKTVRSARGRRSTSCAAPATRASLTTKSTEPSLRGSLESMQRQNATVAAEGLDRIEDEKALRDKIAHKELVALPVSKALSVNEDLSEDRRYCRPWTATFLTDLANSFTGLFHQPLNVSSAVRTVAYQKQLRRRNGNAAAAEGDIVSPHMTGASIDITKKGLNGKQLQWMRERLLDLVKQGKIDVAEEFRQSCFHITVYKSYVPPPPPPKPAATPQQQQAAPSSFLAHFFEGF